MNINKIDYSSAYNDFWSREDRAGSESYEDRNGLVEQIISTVGFGRVLDIGCGEGKLVRALIEKGVDAYGIDVSSVAIDRANQHCPGRFQCASVLDLPFDDQHFDAIISTDCLEHIHPEDVPIAIAELRRICDQYAFFTIATTNDRDGHWHLTVKPREWWEQKFFDAGFMRHPEYYKINSLDHILGRPWQITIPLWIPNKSLISRNLIPKYLREVSETADSVLSCYTDLLTLARSGDIVFHIGAQSVDFALLLRFSSECKEAHIFITKELCSIFCPDEVIFGNVYLYGIDELPNMLDEYTGRINLVVFESTIQASGQDLMHHEILVPGGRVVVMTSTQDVQADIACTSLGEGFRLEEVRKTEFASRRLTCFVFLSSFSAGDQYFSPTIHGYSTPPANLINFFRDYSNPWIPQNLVIPGIRSTNKDILVHESNLILSRPDLQSTPDFGAALCVLGYRMLESDANAKTVAHFISKIEDYLNANELQDGNPHVLRWTVSLRYLMAKLLLKVGNIEAALASFGGVVKKDALRFSPTLMTKVISAYIAIGDISLGLKRVEDAAAAYENGARSGFDALAAPREEWVGKWELPIKGAMYEAIQIADLANVSLLKFRALKLGSQFGIPPLRVFQESRESVFAINSKRYSIIEKQGLRLRELSSALDAQAKMLEERWSIMQSMEALIRERDEAISGQARMLEERWSAMQSMEALIRERDEAIIEQQKLLEKRPTVTEAMRVLLSAVRASFQRRVGRVLGKK